MNNAIRLAKNYVFALVSIFFLTGSYGVLAQSSATLSRSADFSSDDRMFERTDVLHMLVDAPHVDFEDLDENEFRLHPAHGGNDIRGTFTNNFDGTYSASLPLDITDDTVSEWEWRARVKDDSDQEFEMRFPLQIGPDIDNNGGGDDNSGDDNSGDDNSGDDNSGDDNSGDDNSGDDNSGDDNSGDDNSGDDNSGDDNSGDDSSGDDNSGDDNSGDDNSGDDNSGDDNSGDDNSGDDNSGDDGPNDEIEITAEIDQIGNDFIIVGGTTFALDDQTAVLDDLGFPISLLDLLVGDLVEIRADIGLDGVPVATRIKIEDDDDDEIEITGSVEELGAGFIVVGGFEFQVGDNTVVLDDDGFPILFSELSVGMLVQIRGDIGAGGAISATKIKIEDEIQDEVEFTGTIDDISSDSIVISGLTFRITDGLLVLNNQGVVVSVSSLNVGMTVEIRGELLPGGDLVALRIKMEDNSLAAISFVAPVQAVRASSIDVLGVTVHMDLNTAIVFSSSTDGSGSGVVAGQTVEIEAEMTPAGGFIAESIVIQDVILLTAPLTSSSSRELTVGSVSFSVDDRTIVLDSKNRVVSVMDIAGATSAEIRGISEPNGRRATKVKILGSAVSTASELAGAETPSQFRLDANYPNPFNPTTTISFEVISAGSGSNVELLVFDILGRKIKTLVSGSALSGVHQVTWNGTNDSGRLVSSGLYLYRLSVSEKSETRTMMLLK